jgi:hypothetical protein
MVVGPDVQRSYGKSESGWRNLSYQSNENNTFLFEDNNVWMYEGKTKEGDRVFEVGFEVIKQTYLDILENNFFH